MPRVEESADSSRVENEFWAGGMWRIMVEPMCRQSQSHDYESHIEFLGVLAEVV